MKPARIALAAVLVLGVAACDKDDEESVYTITVDPVPEGGAITLGPDLDEYDLFSTVTITATPETGYVFDSWGGDLEATDNPVVHVMEKDIVITATFTAVATYDITIDPTPTGGSITLDPATGPYLEGTEVTVTAASDVGFTFDGWGGDLTGTTNPETLTMDSDKTITATFAAAATYDITIDPTPAYGTITLDPATGPYDAGTMVTVTATPDLAYLLGAWSGDLTGTTNPETLTMDSDKTISATFEYNGDVYVHNDGLDTNPGTPAEPVETIARGYEIIAADDGVGNIHVAAGNYPVDYGAGTHVVAVEGVNVYGGYSATDWTDRDVSDVAGDTDHQSIIDDVTSSGSLSRDVASRAVFVGTGITAATVFDGLVILGGDTGTSYTSGVFMSGGTATFLNCYINGGSGSYAHGVIALDVTGFDLSGNRVLGGDTVQYSSTGLFLENVTGTVTGNIVDGGGGGGPTSRAVHLEDSSVTIAGNELIGGTGGNATCVVLGGTMGVAYVTGNTLLASNGTEDYGELLGISAGANDAVIANNVIDSHTQRLAWTGGIQVDAPGVRILNNTIMVTNTHGGGCLGIETWAYVDGPIIENNIISSEGCLDTGYGIYFEYAGSVANNDITGFTYYVADFGTPVGDLDTTTIGTDAGTGTLESFGNVDVDLTDPGGADYFVDLDGADDDPLTMSDNDYHLTSDAAILNVREGGLDLSGYTVFPTDGSDAIDLDGTARTAGSTSATNANASGWSMGALETD